VRAFVAIPISDDLRWCVEEVKARLLPVRADVKWVEPENYHLTVKFLGNVEEAGIDGVIRALQRAGEESPPFVLEPQGAGFFPNHRHPRVVWVGAGGELDKAAWLGERVDTHLAGLGFEPEKNRKYHLTLGRIRSDRNLQRLVEKVQGLASSVVFPSFMVNEIQLMRSQLNRKGPEYSVLTSIPLTG